MERVRACGLAVVILDALGDPGTSLEDLLDLRDEARPTLEALGDLPLSIERLDAEISRRGEAAEGGGEPW